MVHDKSGGVGNFLGILTLAFIVLKLLGVIAWPWWWVFAPLWIPAGMLLVILFVVYVQVKWWERKTGKL